jgi:nucleoside-triphosphatase
LVRDRKIKNILITGLPGVGKTTLIKKLYENLKPYRPNGFYTEEIREGGTRKGFKLNSFDGRSGVLSHVNIKSPHRVGKYGVDVESFDLFITGFEFESESNNMVIIDEIGKMECCSRVFQTIIGDILDSDKLLLATIALKGGGLIEKIKNRNDVTIFTLSVQNRKTMLSEIEGFIRTPES